MKKKMTAASIGLMAMTILASCGTSDPSITVYTRDTTSGTRDGFMSAIGFSSAKTDNSVLASGYVEVGSNGDMINAVKSDANGIGYISFSTLAASSLKALSYAGVSASETTVLDATYGMTRNFNYLIRADFSSETVQEIVEAFLAFLTTQEGKATMKAEGGILTIANTNPTWASIKAEYPVTALDNSAITVKFGGSTSVEDMSIALTDEFSPLCGNFIAEHNHTGSGDSYKRTQGTDKDASDYLDVGFLSREINLSSSEPAADGTYGKMCTDAIVAVVNSDNTAISNATADILKNIYSGVTTKWSELAA
jgi:phosphate transport system substrate-binding protein